MQENGALVVCDCHGQVIHTANHLQGRTLTSSRLDSSPCTGDAVTDSSLVKRHNYGLAEFRIAELVNIIKF